jgi:hypothetical protein
LPPLLRGGYSEQQLPGIASLTADHEPAERAPHAPSHSGSRPELSFESGGDLERTRRTGRRAKRAVACVLGAARRGSGAAGRWRFRCVVRADVCDARSLPSADGALDIVVSTFGVIVSPDHVHAGPSSLASADQGRLGLTLRPMSSRASEAISIFREFGRNECCDHPGTFTAHLEERVGDAFDVEPPARSPLPSQGAGSCERLFCLSRCRRPRSAGFQPFEERKRVSLEVGTVLLGGQPLAAKLSSSMRRAASSQRASTAALSGRPEVAGRRSGRARDAAEASTQLTCPGALPTLVRLSRRCGRVGREATISPCGRSGSRNTPHGSRNTPHDPADQSGTCRRPRRLADERTGRTSPTRVKGLSGSAVAGRQASLPRMGHTRRCGGSRLLEQRG